MSEPIEPAEGGWELVNRLGKDLKNSAKLIGKRQARFLVDRYYQIQDRRIRDAGQIRSEKKEDDTSEPNDLLQWMFDSDRFLEKDILTALNVFTSEYMIGRYLKSIVGIGPVITAGLIAHLEIEPWKCGKPVSPKGVKRNPCKEKAPCDPGSTPEPCRRVTMDTAGHFHSFCGANPNVVWEKGKMRPYNAFLKTLTLFKAGECFVKVQNNENDTYGQLYAKRKLIEVQNNIDLKFKDQAVAKMEKFKIGKDTDAYKAYSIGMLPPAHVHARARRWAVKIFLSHLHHAMFFDWFGKDPPVPYPMEHLDGHYHFIPLPNWPFTGGGKSLRTMSE